MLRRREAGFNQVPAALIQRFGEGEHKGIGDVASGGQTIFLAPDMPVTYGEVVALGDYFGDWQTLHSLAKRPGIKQGTRGEVWFAVLAKIRADATGQDEDRVEADGLGKVFDQTAVAAVKARFMALAVNNIAHFPNPKRGDAGRSQADKSADFKAMGAGASYRENHVTALTVAAAIGQTRRKKLVPHPGNNQGRDALNDALMLEAFGGHFLTDSFSAGHQQTERASVKEYWDGKIPKFGSNFQNWLAQAIVMHLRKKGGAARVVTPQWARDKIAFPSVQAAMAKIPRLSFGDVVSDALHGYFNTYGVEVDVGGRGITLVGDSHLLTKGPARHVTDESRDTFNAAAAAVKAGITEVYQAAEMGSQGEDPAGVAEKIVKAGGGLFAAEKLLPKLTPDASVVDPRHKSLEWRLPSYKNLFDDKRLAEGFEISLKKYAGMVEGSLSGLSADQMDAVKEVLSKPLLAGIDSIKDLFDQVINYTPISGGGLDPDLLEDLSDLRSGKF
jgi:hypothetical protein